MAPALSFSTPAPAGPVEVVRGRLLEAGPASNSRCWVWRVAVDCRWISLVRKEMACGGSDYHTIDSQAGASNAVST